MVAFFRLSAHLTTRKRAAFSIFPDMQEENPQEETLLDYVLCVEHYRNSESQYDAEDYMVDGIVLMHLPLPPDLERERLDTVMKNLIVQLQTPESTADIKRVFPRFHALREAGSLWWVHLMRKEHKEKLPKDFHTNVFSEEELLGIAPAEDPDAVPKELWFDRDGDPIEGPPDRSMAFLYQ